MVPCPKPAWQGNPSGLIPVRVLRHCAEGHPYWEALAQDCVGFLRKAESTRPSCTLCRGHRVGSGYDAGGLLCHKASRPHAPQHLHRLSGISSRLLLAAMNSSRLVSLPMPEGSPSKSSLLEFTYNFFSLASLQMADWRGDTGMAGGGGSQGQEPGQLSSLPSPSPGLHVRAAR